MGTISPDFHNALINFYRREYQYRDEEKRITIGTCLHLYVIDVQKQTGFFLEEHIYGKRSIINYKGRHLLMEKVYFEAYYVDDIKSIENTLMSSPYVYRHNSSYLGVVPIGDVIFTKQKEMLPVLYNLRRLGALPQCSTFYGTGVSFGEHVTFEEYVYRAHYDSQNNIITLVEKYYLH